MANKTQRFYDEMAGDYHAIFQDWQQSMARQGQVLDDLIRAHLPAPDAGGPIRLLDCAAGIGTQAIPLAQRGYDVRATDLSPVAIQRLRTEAAKAGVEIEASAADMSSLPEHCHEMFDVIIACDNALPHLLADQDLARALASIRAVLRPGGLFLASIRDYDALLAEKPRLTSQRVMGGPGSQRVTLQMWEWHGGGEIYTVTQFILRQEGSEWQMQHYATDYRALRRAALTDLLNRSGYADIQWDMEAYYQPVVLAHAAG